MSELSHVHLSVQQKVFIVKPWSKSKSKPLSKQALKSSKSPSKKKKEGFGPWADTKITWATTPPHHPITFKHEKEYSGKKVLKVKVAQNGPLDSSSPNLTRWQVDSEIKDMG